MDMFADYARAGRGVRRRRPAARGRLRASDAGDEHLGRDAPGDAAAARPVRAAWPSRLESPVTTYNLAARHDVRAARLRSGHGAVGLHRDVASRRPAHPSRSSRTSCSSPASARSPLVGRRADARCWPGSGWPSRCSSWPSACSCWCSRPLGHAVNGNRNWIRLGPLTLQPSEMRQAGARPRRRPVLSRKHRRLDQLGHVLVPFVLPVSAVAVGLVLVGGDLGTSSSSERSSPRSCCRGRARRGGSPSPSSPSAALAVVMVLASPNRLARFDVWLGRDTDPFGQARQPLQGRFALADGRLVRARARRQPREVAVAAPSRTTTSSSRSSARSSACPGPSSSSLLFARARAGLLPARHAHDRRLRAHRDRRRR